jgi:hypothetical protein
MPSGRVSIALYSDTGGGKTTQAGEFAKYTWRTRKLRSVLNSSDMGGHNSINPLVNLGVVKVNKLQESDDPFIWVNDAASGTHLDPAETGLAIFDSGTSMSEAILNHITKADFQIGQQRTQKFTVSKGDGKNARSLTVGINNEAHYGVVQGFMLDAIWKSTWLTSKGIDVLWTFSVHRGEEQDRTPILGPKLAGKALTAAIPKWFNYCWRLASIPVDGGQPRHVLYTAEVPELAGLGHSFGNSRIPLGSTVDIPAVVEPASLITVFDMLDQAEKGAEDRLREELGL